MSEIPTTRMRAVQEMIDQNPELRALITERLDRMEEDEKNGTLIYLCGGASIDGSVLEESDVAFSAFMRNKLTEGR